MDVLNSRLVSVGWDGWVRFWAFVSRQSLGGVEFPGAVLRRAQLCRDKFVIVVVVVVVVVGVVVVVVVVVVGVVDINFVDNGV